MYPTPTSTPKRPATGRRHPLGRKRRRRRRIFLLSFLLLLLAGVCILVATLLFSPAEPGADGLENADRVTLAPTSAPNTPPAGYQSVTMTETDLSSGLLALVSAEHPLLQLPSPALTQLQNEGSRGQPLLSGTTTHDG